MSGTSKVVPFLNVSSLCYHLSSCVLSCGRKRRLDPGGRVGILSCRGKFFLSVLSKR